MHIFWLTSNFFGPISKFAKKAKLAARWGRKGTGLMEEARLPGKGDLVFLFIRCFMRNARQGGKNAEG